MKITKTVVCPTTFTESKFPAGSYFEHVRLGEVDLCYVVNWKPYGDYDRRATIIRFNECGNSIHDYAEMATCSYILVDSNSVKLSYHSNLSHVV